ncbi:DEAD/DEAH box helicase [uncultured Hydrogenophaga sp.]|uniref:DEAD/DEAH box helicase n=1 Tax=uncultured Hydrogenophaga sp. TaxID=199683 RepID=UPI002660405B|nr:DEAD/DEAH box helicase [uncultured Hydrogenophaga sp.]
MTFDELNLAPAIVQAVREQGYDTPTPIQAEAIPAVLAGRDLLAGAQTGTGKTAAFTLPMLQRLSASPRAKSRFGGIGIRALVLTPTRELAAQVEESVRNYGKHVDLTSTVVFGGVGMNPQINAMKRGVDILVATPGRLLDLQQQGFLDLSQVQMLVLDEADRMLDMGFIHDVKKVLALVPRDKQSLLFSATFSDEIRDLANGLLKDPQHIQVTPRNTTVQRISQVIHPVGRGKKKALLVHIINQHNWSQVLVFTRTKFGANNVADYLEKNGISAMALHGNKSQGARTQALAGFKSGDIRALVATDIAARGIDIDELPHVVNYEIPNVCEDYVHRIGRTGRAGREGHAVNLVSLDEEGFMMEIERFTKQQIPVEIFQEFMPEPGEKAEPIAMGRQTIWGGAGKPPSRDVMAAAAKAARQEMMQRIREKKVGEGQGRGGRGGPRAAGEESDGDAPREPREPRENRGEGRADGRRQGGQRPQQANGQGQGQGQGRGGRGGQGGQGAQGAQRPPRGDRNDRGDRGDRGDRADRGDREPGAERQPGPNAHLGSLRIREPRPRQANPGGQPDPLRTSIDAMRTGNRHNKGGKGGGKGGQQGGPADPLRTSYGRIR